jgi:DnaJ-class molecular chaperone
MKDYYAILGVDKKTDLAEIKKQYRKRAMAFHPDRNPDNPEAELKFKELAEAYGVLSDPQKKKEYDRYKATGFRTGGSNGASGFDYSQEDILRDLFNDPRFQNMFQSLIRDFQRSGFRGDSRFFKQTMFGSKGMRIGSLFVFGSIAGAKVLARSPVAKIAGKTMLKTLAKGVTSLLTGALNKNSGQEGSSAASASPSASETDLHYHIRLSHEELTKGKWIQVVTGISEEKIRVKIPGQSEPGKTLRVRGKGHQLPAGKRGDLYIHLE